MTEIRSLLWLSLSVLGLGSIAFVGYTRSVLVDFLFLVDRQLFSAFVTEFGFAAIAALAIGRALLILVVYINFTTSFMYPREEKNDTYVRGRRKLFWMMLTRSPEPLQAASISLSVVAFLWIYLGWQALSFAVVASVILALGLGLLFRFRKSARSLYYSKHKNRSFLNLISGSKFAFIVSTALMASSYVMGEHKGRSITDSEGFLICYGASTKSAFIIGRNNDGIIISQLDSDGNVAWAGLMILNETTFFVKDGVGCP